MAKIKETKRNKAITAMSVVPPPISTTIDPTDSLIGSDKPIAAAIGSSTINTFLAPAATAASFTAFSSTAETSDGTPTTTRGPKNLVLKELAFLI
jgi:hypothetical protein